MAEIVIPFGKDAVLFYDVAGSIPHTAANRLDAARDVTVTIEKEEGDASRRSFPGWTDTREGMKTLRMSFDLVMVIKDNVASEDDGINAIKTAFLTGAYGGASGIALYARQAIILEDDEVLYGGMWGDFIITGFTINQPLKDIQTISVEAKATLLHGQLPAWSQVEVLG